MYNQRINCDTGYSGYNGERSVSTQPPLIGTRLIANLRHPNIVQVYDFGEQDDHTYLVQELLAGPMLGAWMSDLAAFDPVRLARRQGHA